MSLLFYQIGAVVSLALFYGVYLGKMITQRNKGIQTDQIGKGKKKSSLLCTEIVMKIATYIIIPAEIVSILIGQSGLGQERMLTGLLLALLGDAVFALSVYTMRDSWRAGIPEKDQTALVTRGIYQWSRNPAFLGFDLVYLGILLMFFNWVLLILTLFAMLMLHLQILQEEKYLPTVFGDAYLQYKKHTFRYLGRK